MVIKQKDEIDVQKFKDRLEKLKEAHAKNT